MKTKNYNIKIASKRFVGDCVTGLNDGYFQHYVADDATNLAHLVENGEEITSELFLTHCVVPPENLVKLQQNPNNYKFYYNEGENVAWYYDEAAGVEYFYI